MYKFAVVAIALFWSVSVSAAEWIVVADTTLGQLTLDKASVGTQEKLTTATLVYEFKGLQRLSSAPFSVFNKRQDDVLVDCSGQSMGIIRSRFLEDDKLVSTFSLKASEVKFKPAAKETMVETVIHSICTARP
jgi:hypothetical protein